MPSALIPVNETLTSATVSADPFLSFVLNPGTTYNIVLTINWEMPNSIDGGIAIGLTATNNATLTWTTPSDGATHGSGDVVRFINVAGPRTVVINGSVTTGVSGSTISFMRGLAQAHFNPTTIYARSSFAATEILQTALSGLSTAQVIELSCQIARVPGFKYQAGQLLNAVLSDLAQTYDFEINLRTYGFTFNTSNVYQNNTAGAGPNLLPSDYLRAKNKEIIYYIDGVRYVLIVHDQPTYDSLVQTAGWNSYPTYGYVDLRLQAPFNTSNPSQPGLMVWPPASGAFTAQVRYFCQPPMIASPESNPVVCWFPNTNYLITRLAGELMKITDDERTNAFLGEGAQGAEGILLKYLKLHDDPEGKVKTVQLDRRHFGPSFAGLRNTKNIGW